MLTLGSEPFIPQNPERVTMYVCGPTVYAQPHIGNLRSAVNFDILHRVLRRLYPEVVMVRNYTDIDDKIMKAAKDRSQPIESVTAEAIAHYESAMDRLNVVKPTAQPLVTESMDEIRAFIAGLIASGAAYQSEGHVLFDRVKNPMFFLVENLDPANLVSDDTAPNYKHHAHDFVLWKPSSADQPGWESPWGRGRPGWHIECSAMIAKHLGETIDIHGGGVDLKFPHHENECAQSHALHGKPLARYWVHNGMLEMDGKMSKERGNIVYLDDLLAKVSAETVRYFFLTGHYRQPLTFSMAGIEAADRSLRAIQRSLRMVGPMMPEYTKYVPRALLNDLNTPRALAKLHALSALVASNTASDDIIQEFISLADLLGVNTHFEERADDEVVALRQKRANARASRDFAEADRLRDVLISMGVEVNDAPISAG